MGHFGTDQLLDFLEDSPTLQIVQLVLYPHEFSEATLQQWVVILPNVETFVMFLEDHTVASEAGFKIAAHLSCCQGHSTLLLST